MIYRKVRLRLTLLCTGITAVIMTVMSFCYLYVSEAGLYRNQFQSFKNDMNTIATNLEQQTVISMEWLSKMEAQGNYLFFVLDNGEPFLYNRLGDPEITQARNLLLGECLDAYDALPDGKAISGKRDLDALAHAEFDFVSPSTGVTYFGSVILSGADGSALEIVVLSSIRHLEEQIREQRLRFVVIDIAAVLALGVFAWFFTGKLLAPIVENQRNQTLFIASASHELRTPLSVILSAVECCQSAPPERQPAFLIIIQQESMRISSLVSDMLTLSQSDSHRFSIQPRPVELDTLLINSCEAFEPLAQEKSISLSIELPDSALPLCNADPDRISQVLSILLHNAVSYTPEHGRITLSLRRQKDRFQIAVIDNGIGISEEDKKKIFDRFYRADRSRSVKGHFGLGLSIAYEIVKAHGGSIRVSDAEGGGSCFTVVI